MRRATLLLSGLVLVACGGDPALLPGTTEPASTGVPTSTLSTSATTETTTEPPAETTTTLTPTGSGWVRGCAEQVGSADAEPFDAYSGQEFGPLAPEPGLRIVYPIGDQPENWGTPMSSVWRVPGGVLISIVSNVPESVERVVAVVDDSGSVRWRRCIPGWRGWFGVVDASDGVVDLEVYTGDASSSQWWAFDLRTGESEVVPIERDAELTALAEEARAMRTDVGFIVNGGLPSSWLQRFNEQGSLLWERPDLTPLGGEGFRVQETDDGVLLVLACVGSPLDESSVDWPPCPLALLGIDMFDGHTRWQWDGSHYPWLIAGHYAIVSRDWMSDDESSLLVDTRTGQVVADGVTDAPSVFRTECCGGYEYRRVEASGAVAWSVATYVLDVWYPAGSPGPGVTVDLFGPSTTPVLEAHVIGSTAAGPVCAIVLCDQIAAALFGFSPGSTVVLSCRWQSEGAWLDVDAPAATAVIGADGSGYVVDVCATDQHAQAVQVVTDSAVVSNVLIP